MKGKVGLPGQVVLRKLARAWTHTHWVTVACSLVPALHWGQAGHKEGLPFSWPWEDWDLSRRRGLQAEPSSAQDRDEQRTETEDDTGEGLLALLTPTRAPM